VKKDFLVLLERSSSFHFYRLVDILMDSPLSEVSRKLKSQSDFHNI
jgi:hypothetical protein